MMNKERVVTAAGAFSFATGMGEDETKACMRALVDVGYAVLPLNVGSHIGMVAGNLEASNRPLRSRRVRIGDKAATEAYRVIAAFLARNPASALD